MKGHLNEFNRIRFSLVLTFKFEYGQYFLGNLIETAEDPDLKEVLNEIKTLSTFQEKEASKFLADNGLNATPFFSENDLHSPSEKIFSDQLMIEIIKHITSNGMGVLSFQYTDLIVPEVKNFYKEILNRLMQIDISILNLLEQKGLPQNKSFHTNRLKAEKAGYLKWHQPSRGRLML